MIDRWMSRCSLSGMPCRVVVALTSGALPLILAGLTVIPAAGVAQVLGVPPRVLDDPISVTFQETPIPDVLLAFARFSGRSIVSGQGVSGEVTAEILEQPWFETLRILMEAHELVVETIRPDLLRVDRIETQRARLERLPLETRTFRVYHIEAHAVEASTVPLLTPRGRVTVTEPTNTLVVTDTPEALDRVMRLVEALDSPPRGILISARIVLIHRSALNAVGVTYTLSPRRGEEVGGGSFGDGVGTGLNFMALGAPVLRGGSSTARLLRSLALGQADLATWIDALVSEQLAEVEAHPQLTVLENETASLLVGERIPIPTVQYPGPPDPEGGGVIWGGAPPVSVRFEEVGIRLVVTPSIMNDGRIHLDLQAERSGVQWLEVAPGFLVNTQEAATRLIVTEGQTAVIGGLTVTEATRAASSVPGLGRIPWIGRLFRSTREEQIQRDLLILVTPYLHPDLSQSDGRD